MMVWLIDCLEWIRWIFIAGGLFDLFCCWLWFSVVLSADDGLTNWFFLVVVFLVMVWIVKYCW